MENIYLNQYLCLAYLVNDNLCAQSAQLTIDN